MPPNWVFVLPGKAKLEIMSGNSFVDNDRPRILCSGARIFYPAINVLRELKWRDIFVAFFLIAFKGYRPIPFLLSHRQNLFGRIRVESDVFEKENVGVTPERGLVWRRRQSVLQRC